MTLKPAQCWKKKSNITFTSGLTVRANPRGLLFFVLVSFLQIAVDGRKTKEYKEKQKKMKLSFNDMENK